MSPNLIYYGCATIDAAGVWKIGKQCKAYPSTHLMATCICQKYADAAGPPGPFGPGSDAAYDWDEWQPYKQFLSLGAIQIVGDQTCCSGASGYTCEGCANGVADC